MTTTTVPFHHLDLHSYIGRRFRFRDHADASFFGIGPWVLRDGETGRAANGCGSIALTFVPAPGGFSYSGMVIVWPQDVTKYFDVEDGE